MYRPRLLVTAPALLLTFLLSGCDEGLPTMPIHDAPDLASAQRPFTGACETTFDPIPLPPPPVFTQVDRGTCRLAHLGRAEFYSMKDIDFASGTQTTTEATFTSANGDILRAVGSGTSAPGGPGRVSFSATLTFVGGTGRFTHATGQAHVVGEANVVSRTASLTIDDGWIVYDASDRSARAAQR